jgi:hypothetical protein
MKVAVHQPQYIPWLGYFHKMASSDLFVLLDTVQYKKREFQNRNRIKTPAGPLWLTIPVLTKGSYLQKISEVRIDHQERWAEKHRHGLERNYSHEPYYKKYRNFLEEIYGRKWESLLEVNMATIKYLGRALNLATPIMLESTLGTTQTRTGRIIEICQKVKADIYLSGQGAKDYLDENLLAQNGITLEYQEFVHPVYPQLYGPFIPYLSVLDLIFNCGPDSRKILLG